MPMRASASLSNAAGSMVSGDGSEWKSRSTIAEATY
jgi:hypothetical protein